MSDATTSQTDVTAARVAELAADGALLIDVRRPYEWEGGRLAGAVNIEMNDLPARSAEVDRERIVVFYCRTGNRSGMAAQAFREAGYDAYHLATGIVGWVEEGRELDPADGEVRDPPPPS